MSKAKGRRGDRAGQPPRQTRLLNQDDEALWQAYTRGIDRANMKPRVDQVEAPEFKELFDSPVVTHERRGDVATGVAKNDKKVTTRARPRGAALAKPSEIDAKSVRRIGSGRERVDARIDLHGMRQHEAHSALRAFLFRSAAKGHRMVLVITGKGAVPGDDRGFGSFVGDEVLGRGVLRRKVPQWLAEADLGAVVVGHAVAHIRHGGEGALYVQLRSKRRR